MNCSFKDFAIANSLSVRVDRKIVEEGQQQLAAVVVGFVVGFVVVFVPGATAPAFVPVCIVIGVRPVLVRTTVELDGI
jgi:uncharacterized membrane protein YgaE (UPF0421/DUF939 family)